MLKVLKIKHGGEIKNIEQNMKYWGECAHCKASFTRTINVTVFSYRLELGSVQTYSAYT